MIDKLLKNDKFFVNKTIGDFIKGNRLLDAFSGYGRLYDVYNKHKPSEVVMVDFNKKAIDLANSKNHENVKTYCNDMLSWCK